MVIRNASIGDAPASPGLARAMTNQVLAARSDEGSLDLYLPAAGVLLDWQLMTSYSSEARYALTRFVMRTGNRQPGHFLVASRIVAMGVSAASLTLALTGVKLASYASRPSFERVLGDALPSDRGAVLGVNGQCGPWPRAAR